MAPKKGGPSRQFQGADGRPQARGDQMQQVGEGQEAGPEPRVLFQSRKHPHLPPGRIDPQLPVQKGQFVLPLPENDPGAAGHLRRIPLLQITPEFLAHFGAFLISHSALRTILSVLSAHLQFTAPPAISAAGCKGENHFTRIGDFEVPYSSNILYYFVDGHQVYL